MKYLGIFFALLALALAPQAASVAARPAAAQPAGRVLLTSAEALELAFPKCEIQRSTVYLTKEQRAQAEKLAGFEVKGLARPYVATKDGKVVGTAYFDSHRVRTLKESIMIVVGTDGAIQRIEVLAFGEPLDYLPGAKWYAQFKGKVLNDDLRLRKGIRAVTGATLTAQATTDSARRILAVHQVLAAAATPAK